MRRRLFDDNAKEIRPIERALLTCYGKDGKCALIKLTESGEYVLTHDGTQLLNSMRLDNHLYALQVKAINRHAQCYGDNAKLLFLYMNESLRLLDDEARAGLRVVSISAVIDRVRVDLSKQKHLHKFVEVTNDNFVELACGKMCVLSDLKKFNKTLCLLANEIIINLVNVYLRNNNIQRALRSMMDDFKFTLVYSNGNVIQNSKIFHGGFLLDSKMNGSFGNQRFKAIFVAKSEAASQATIDIKSLDIFVDIQRLNFFPKEFLNSLSSNEVNFVFFEGSMNEFKQQSLRSLNCCFVSYLSRDFIEFMCRKLNLSPVYEDELFNSKVIDLKASLFEISSVDLVEKDVYYYRLEHVDISFVYICSPVRAVFSQFRNHIYKVIKTVLSLFENEQALAVECNKFEAIMAKMFADFEYGEQNGHLKAVYRFLKRFLESMNSKLNYSKCELYEPLNLKVSVFCECLAFVKTIAKIDYICFIEKNSTPNKLDDSD